MVLAVILAGISSRLPQMKPKKQEIKEAK